MALGRGYRYAPRKDNAQGAMIEANIRDAVRTPIAWYGVGQGVAPAIEQV